MLFRDRFFVSPSRTVVYLHVQLLPNKTVISANVFGSEYHSCKRSADQSGCPHSRREISKVFW